jgi:hypothetical protein
VHTALLRISLRASRWSHDLRCDNVWVLFLDNVSED